jgi:uncharacterized membrane protein YbhN (UPF0104 family)
MSKITEITKKIDKEALAGAIGLMCLSWAALPIVYWLIIKKKEGGEKDG